MVARERKIFFQHGLDAHVGKHGKVQDSTKEHVRLSKVITLPLAHVEHRRTISLYMAESSESKCFGISSSQHINICML